MTLISLNLSVRFLIGEARKYFSECQR